VNNGVSGLYTGGLVGYNNSGTVTNSFWDNITTSQSTSAGGTGMTTSQMMTQAYFETGSPFIAGTGWDFTNTWFMIDGSTRPFLRMEYSTNIINAHQLQLMAMNLAASYTLGANISMSELSNASDMWGGYYGFVPIGNNATPFTGTFNGQNHTITGLAINHFWQDYVGLFGYIGSGSSVSNVGLVGGTVTGGRDTGSLVGYNKGIISDSYAGVSVAGSYGVGGLVGWNSEGTIETSYATGNVSGAGDVGGLLGGNYLGPIQNVYATGSTNGKYAVGGLVGSSYGTVADSFLDTEASGTVTGIGDGNTTGATGKTTIEMKTAATYAGWSTTVWNIAESSYPTLKN